MPWSIPVSNHWHEPDEGGKGSEKGGVEEKELGGEDTGLSICIFLSPFSLLQSTYISSITRPNP